MSADRLAELRHQRALTAEQLAWLDREIAAAEGARGLGGASPTSGVVADSPAPLRLSHGNVPTTPLRSSPTQMAMADRHKIEAEVATILDSQRAAPEDVKKGVFRGCLVYLAFAFFLTALGLVTLYFAFKLR